MREFKIPKKPYDEYQVYKKTTVEIKEGVTVLVGCNGAGKSTLLSFIKDQLENDNIPVVYFDNYKNGGSSSIDKCMFHGDINTAAGMMIASEGERIYMNIGLTVSRLKKFFSKESKEYWILLDAIGSGMSIDAIIEIRNFFLQIVDELKNKDKNLYIVISTNEYEFCVGGTNTFDVQEGKYINILDYEGYRKFILKTRKQKDKFMNIEKEEE